MAYAPPAPPDLHQAVLSHPPRMTALRPLARPALTGREREVLGLVAGGLTGSEIADCLVLSPETIKSHVHNAMAKLSARTRAHAVAIALGTGQIDVARSQAPSLP